MGKDKVSILIVDDEPDICEFIEYNLTREGYEVHKANNGYEAISIVEQKHPNLVLLDIMMPEMDGIETCVRIRSNKKYDDVLVAFLTARIEDYSQISGFEVGADDYITKPIKPRLLISRVKGLLRRFGNDEEATAIEFENLTIDKEEYMVKRNGIELSLPKKEFELLFLLASKPGKVFQRQEILSKIWGSDVIVGDRTIDVHIRKLREKLGDHMIRTVKGIGYKLIFNE